MTNNSFCSCTCHSDNPEWFKNGCWACRCWGFDRHKGDSVV